MKKIIVISTDGQTKTEFFVDKDDHILIPEGYDLAMFSSVPSVGFHNEEALLFQKKKKLAPTIIMGFHQIQEGWY